MKNKKYHYVYRITNKENNKHYYGVRSSKIEPKLDLGLKYFSSSTDKEFINEQKSNKDKFKYKIIKTFETRIDAMNMEIKLHNKFNVGKNEKFYNLAEQLSTSFSNISKESILKLKTTLNSISEDGLSISQKANKNRLMKTNFGKAIYKNGLTYNEFYGYEAARSRKDYQHIINQKVSETKQNQTSEEKEIMKIKFRETMKKIQENGLSKMQNKANKHSISMQNRSHAQKEETRLKYLETMNLIGEDGLTGFQRRTLTRSLKRKQKDGNE